MVNFLFQFNQNKVNSISKKVWDILGCNSCVRIDMIVSNGITKKSLIAKSTKVKGLEFSELLYKIIEVSLV